MNDGLNITQKKERRSFGTSGHEEKNRVSRMVPRIGMTIDETADYTGIGRTTLRHLIRSGKIPTLKIGRKTIIRINSLAPVFYAAMLGLLALTILIAPDIKGSHSWLVIGPLRLQPAEFAKVTTALFLA